MLISTMAYEKMIEFGAGFVLTNIIHIIIKHRTHMYIYKDYNLKELVAGGLEVAKKLRRALCKSYTLN